MKKNPPMRLHIDTVSVGHQVPIGRSSLEASIAQHLHQRAHAGMTAHHKPGSNVHIPEVRIKAHPSASSDALGELIAQRIGEQIQDHE